MWERALPANSELLQPAPASRPPVLRLTRTHPECPHFAGSLGLPAQSVRVFYAAERTGDCPLPAEVPANGPKGFYCGFASRARSYPQNGCGPLASVLLSRTKGGGGRRCGSTALPVETRLTVGAGLPANFPKNLPHPPRGRRQAAAFRRPVQRHKRPAPSEPGDRGSRRCEG